MPEAPWDSTRAYRTRLGSINLALERTLPPPGDEPRRLHEAMRYAVFGGGGGKRLRPLLVLTTASDLDLASEAALGPAVAVELIHSYSLVHDDLPCMDDASTRRGVPSVAAAYGCADAVLAGDGLLGLAFEVLGLMNEPGIAAALTVDLARAAGPRGMLGGQHADLDAQGERASALSGNEHPALKVARLKTARLFGFSFSAAARVAGRGESFVSGLKRAGEEFGLAFQIADDLEDAGEDDGAPNFARAAGREAAIETAGRAVDRSIELLGMALEGGPGDSETALLVRRLAKDLGISKGPD